MGDWIKENKVTASVLISMMLFFIFMFSVAKPYVDRENERQNQEAFMRDSVYKSLLQQGIDINQETSATVKTMSEDLKKILNSKQDGR